LGRGKCPRCGRPGIFREREVTGFTAVSYELYCDHGRKKPRLCYLGISNKPWDPPAPTQKEDGVKSSE
jgi:hypothetical protein